MFSINVSFSNRTFGCLILLSCRLTVLAGFFTKQNPSLANPVPLFVATKITRSNTACAPPFEWICNVHCQNQQPICRSGFLRTWITEGDFFINSNGVLDFVWRESRGEDCPVWSLCQMSKSQQVCQSSKSPLFVE